MSVSVTSWDVDVPGKRIDGEPWRIRFHELQGSRPGPSTAIVAGIIGDKPLAVLAVHVAFGIALTMENWGARPIAYMQKVNEKATFSSRSMIVTGAVILVFVVIHILHFTGHFWVGDVDALVVSSTGYFDVYTMVVQGFNKVAFVLVYAIAMACVFLHVFHGIGSFFQTLGLANDDTLDYVGYFGKLVSFVLVIGYFAVIICGAVKA